MEKLYPMLFFSPPSPAYNDAAATSPEPTPRLDRPKTSQTTPAQSNSVPCRSCGVSQSQATQPNTTIERDINFGRQPQRTTCPYCRKNIVTVVEYYPTRDTHLSALIVCVFCCCFAPYVYCSDSCLGMKHYCPNCKKFLGRS